MGRRPLSEQLSLFPYRFLNPTNLCGFSSPFELLSLASGQVTNALLTRSPLGVIANPSFDLHVLGTPPAFILSQDQTLRSICFKLSTSRWFHPNYSLLSLFIGIDGSSYHSSVVKVPCPHPPGDCQQKSDVFDGASTSASSRRLSGTTSFFTGLLHCETVL